MECCLSLAGSEGSVGLLADVLSDSGSDPRYEDFFDPPREDAGGHCGGVTGITLRDKQVEGSQEWLSAHEKRQLKVSPTRWLLLLLLLLCFLSFSSKSRSSPWKPAMWLIGRGR